MKIAGLRADGPVGPGDPRESVEKSKVALALTRKQGCACANQEIGAGVLGQGTESIIVFLPPPRNRPPPGQG
jgi:hypothetical protein